MDLQIIKIASDNKNQKILKKYTHEIKNKNFLVLATSPFAYTTYVLPLLALRSNPPAEFI